MEIPPVSQIHEPSSPQQGPLYFLNSVLSNAQEYLHAKSHSNKEDYFANQLNDSMCNFIDSMGLQKPTQKALITKVYDDFFLGIRNQSVSGTANLVVEVLSIAFFATSFDGVKIVPPLNLPPKQMDEVDTLRGSPPKNLSDFDSWIDQLSSLVSNAKHT